ncbi:MAG TPA: DNA-processing protein DprA [Nitrospirota bacterium]
MTNDKHPAFFWIGLSSIPGVGRITFRKLVNRFGTPERALSATPDELKELNGLPRKLAAEIGASSWREAAGREIERAADSGVDIVTLDDPSYPENLRSAPDPPLYLYIKGELKQEDRKAVAMVGTRKPTHYGTAVTQRIASELASAGFTVVSGMARGIDTQAHKGALAAKGRTIAVLGCGIDVAYPPENKGLMEEISKSGAVVTENPFGTRPEAGYFPARNRIISGLSRGTVIVEAAEDSGSLITAQYTLEQGRKLYAVPGNVGSTVSKGTNSLIKRGAALVEDAEDIMRGLGMNGPGTRMVPGQRPLPALTQEEEVVFRCITGEPKHIDSIMNECRADAGRLSGALLTLELKGLAKQLPGKYYVREV